MAHTQTANPALLVDESTALFSPRLNALCSPRGVFKGTREEWLEAASLIMSQWLNHVVNNTTRTTVHKGKTTNHHLAIPLKKYLADRLGGKPSDYTYKPTKVRFSCSLMGDTSSTLAANKNHVAHCDYMERTGNNYDEIRMCVTLGGRKTKHDSARVADILLHEMIHTMARRCGHRGAFKIIATTVGLKGQMTATVAGQELRLAIWNQVVTRLGKYPHSAVHLTPRGERKKGSRLIKCVCPQCQFNLRTTRKWLDKAEGRIYCPMHCLASPQPFLEYQHMTTEGYTYTPTEEEE